MRLGVAILAAGRSSRFQSDKLFALWQGTPLLECAVLKALSLSAERMIVVVGSESAMELAQRLGAESVKNRHAERGQAYSVRLAVEALAELDGVLMMAADMPLLSEESLRRLVEAWQCGEKGICCLQDDSHRGNPAIFSKRYFDELCSLEGDIGAKKLLKCHENDLCVVNCVTSHELADTDTPEQLAELKSLFCGRNGQDGHIER